MIYTTIAQDYIIWDTVLNYSVCADIQSLLIFSDALNENTNK